MPFKKGERPPNPKPFEPGNNANPTGRPKGSQNRNTIARKVLSMEINVPADLYKHFEELYPNLPKTMSIEQIATLSVMRKAVNDGEYLHYKAVMDSAYGSPKQEIDMRHEVYDVKLNI